MFAHQQGLKYGDDMPRISNTSEYMDVYTVARLPPYHLDLNPIELIWANVKGYVARNNNTFKMKDVSALLAEGIPRITPEVWQNAICHVTDKVEHAM